MASFHLVSIRYSFILDVVFANCFKILHSYLTLRFSEIVSKKGFVCCLAEWWCFIITFFVFNGGQTDQTQRTDRSDTKDRQTRHEAQTDQT